MFNTLQVPSSCGLQKIKSLETGWEFHATSSVANSAPGLFEPASR
jgi:hypothetical protein